MIDIEEKDYTPDGWKNFKHIVLRDLYRIGEWPCNYFDYIFDIGAHIGIFSTMMRFKHPQSKIIAVEPNKKALSILDQNTIMLDIDLVNKAIGNGQIFYLHEKAKSLGQVAFSDSETTLNSIESISLYDLFVDYGATILDKYLIKMDCEGGEVYVFEDERSKEILQYASHICMEVHFDEKGEFNPNWPKWKYYNDYVMDNFNTTHHIEYHTSSKSRGYGHYSIKKRIINET